jgi:hypothetical protein
MECPIARLSCVVICDDRGIFKAVRRYLRTRTDSARDVDPEGVGVGTFAKTNLRNSEVKYLVLIRHPILANRALRTAAVGH